jgi:hypothetical protein
MPLNRLENGEWDEDDDRDHADSDLPEEEFDDPREKLGGFTEEDYIKN